MNSPNLAARKERHSHNHPFERVELAADPTSWSEAAREQFVDLTRRSFGHYGNAKEVAQRSEKEGADFFNDFWLTAREPGLIADGQIHTCHNIMYIDQKTDKPMAFLSFYSFEVPENYNYHNLHLPKGARVILFRKIMADPLNRLETNNRVKPYWGDAFNLLGAECVTAEGKPVIMVSHFQPDSLRSLRKMGLLKDATITSVDESGKEVYFDKTPIRAKLMSRALNYVYPFLEKLVAHARASRKVERLMNDLARIARIPASLINGVMLAIDENDDQNSETGATAFVAFLLKKGLRTTE